MRLPFPAYFAGNGNLNVTKGSLNAERPGDFPPAVPY